MGRNLLKNISYPLDLELTIRINIVLQGKKAGIEMNEKIFKLIYSFRPGTSTFS
jgi:hypothetical protein